MNVKYVIQLTRFVNDTIDYSSRCAAQYYDRPLLFASREEVDAWLTTYGYHASKYRENIYIKEGRGTAQGITWSNYPVPTDYFAVILEVNPDRTKGHYQTLAICGHAE